MLLRTVLGLLCVASALLCACRLASTVSWRWCWLVCWQHHSPVALELGVLPGVADWWTRHHVPAGLSPGLAGSQCHKVLHISFGAVAVVVWCCLSVLTNCTFCCQGLAMPSHVPVSEQDGVLAGLCLLYHSAFGQGYERLTWL
jgi:hypothetical protein